jgi:hypothetical protein
MPRFTPLVLALVAVGLTACSTGTPANPAPSASVEAGVASSKAVDESRKNPAAG